jgi:phosphoserine phosphatase
VRPKILFCDMEGTLLRANITYDNGKVAPSAWTVLAARLGTACYEEEEASKDRWNRGDYAGYVDWMVDSIRILQRHGLREAHFLEVMDAVQPMSGIDEAFSTFRSWGATTVLVTGGFKYLADRLQCRLKIDHAFSACELFFEPKTGRLIHFNLLPSDVKGKVDFMKLIAAEHNVDPGECAFVGDGMNDVHLARVVGCSIAFNAQEKLRAVASRVIEQPDDQEDFRAVPIEINNWQPPSN